MYVRSKRKDYKTENAFAGTQHRFDPSHVRQTRRWNGRMMSSADFSRENEDRIRNRIENVAWITRGGEDDDNIARIRRDMRVWKR